MKELYEVISHLHGCLDNSCEGNPDEEYDPETDGLACYEIPKLKYKKWCRGCLSNKALELSEKLLNKVKNK